MGANAETDVWTYVGSTLKVCVCVMSVKCRFIKVWRDGSGIHCQTLQVCGELACARAREWCSLIKQKLETFSFSSFLNVMIFCFSLFYIIVSVSMVFRHMVGYNKLCEDITMKL